jgi:L-ascorbate metabolism protein UlaG (beta-lactamase superfamily)
MTHRDPYREHRSSLNTHLTYIGHATVQIDLGDIRVLTDPFLRDRLLFLRRHGDTPAMDLISDRPVDVVAISHLHYDHVDLPSLRQLGPHPFLIAPKGAAAFLQRMVGGEVHEMRAGDALQVGQVEITAVPSEHMPATSPSRPATECLGYVFDNGKTIYFAGDTDLFDGMADLGRNYDVDLALLPVSGYTPRVPAGHLTPQTAAQSLCHIRPRVAVPIHWGALRPLGPHRFWHRMDYLHQPPQVFADHAARLAPKTQVCILQPGQSMAVV